METNRNGTSKEGLEVTCLAFADDIAPLTDSEQDAVRQIEVFKECTEKVGLQISFEKAEFFGTKLEPQNYV